MDEPLAIVFLIKPWYCQDVFIQWLKTKCINDATTIYCGAYFDVCLVYGNLVQWDRIVHWLHLHHKKDLLMCTWTTAAASSELSDVRCFFQNPFAALRIPASSRQSAYHPDDFITPCVLLRDENFDATIQYWDNIVSLHWGGRSVSVCSR